MIFIHCTWRGRAQAAHRPRNDKLEIASFVILGDAELATAARRSLRSACPRRTSDHGGGQGHSAGAGACADAEHEKLYRGPQEREALYVRSVVTEVYSITTQQRQILCLDRAEMEFIRGKRVMTWTT